MPLTTGHGDHLTVGHRRNRPADRELRRPASLSRTPAPLDSADLRRAMTRFGAAGLTLPDLRIRFSDDADDCHRHAAIFDHGPTPWTITVCSDLSFVLDPRARSRLIETNVDLAARDNYLEARDLHHWNDQGVEWSDRGVEDAAFIIQQNLMISPAAPLSHEWQRRVLAYQLLTGRHSRSGTRSASAQCSARSHPIPSTRRQFRHRCCRVRSPGIGRPPPAHPSSCSSTRTLRSPTALAL